VANGTPAVLACSALREAYRESLLPSGAGRRAVELVQLDVAPSLAEQRLSARRGPYMPAALVASQFATLEEPSAGMRVDASLPVNEIVTRIRQTLGWRGADVAR
jgi:carbohydrate kinase (thermoresistant glucokinase family)